MPATIKVMKCTSVDAGTETDVTGVGVRLKSIDDATTAPESAPITIPDEGTVYSYETWLRFKCTVAPDNQCTNFKIWSLGNEIQEGKVKVSINTDAVDTGVTPVDTESIQGTRGMFSDRNSESKIDVAGTLVNIDDETDYSVLQLEVDSTAVQGDISQSNEFNYSYDEN